MPADQPLRIAYFGSGQFAVAPLEALLNRRDLSEVVAVVCQPDRPVGRRGQLEACPVGQLAARLAGGTAGQDSPRFKLLKPVSVKNNADFAAELADLKPDLAVVASYGQILPASLLAVPRLGFLNLHGSLLPEWRGASPIQAAILAGQAVTGVSLMVMDAKLDHGPVIKMASLEITPNDTWGSLEGRLSRLAAELAVSAIPAYAAGQLKAVDQDHAQASFCRTLRRQDGQISWSAEPADRVERKLRAFTPWPGIYTVWNRGEQALRLKLLGVRAEDDDRGLPPGTVVLSADGYPSAVAADGRLVVFLKVQLEGKPACSGQALLRGHHELIGAQLENPARPRE